MNIIDCLDRTDVDQGEFRGESWKASRVLLRAIFGLPIEDPTDLAIFQECTGLVEPPKQPTREVAVICGRQSGKSRLTALIATYMACFGDWKERFARGEGGMAFIIAVDRNQAKIIKNACSAIINDSRHLRRLVKNETADTIELRNGVTIAVKTSSFRSVRGYRCIFCVLEECAFFRTDESANPDFEIANAIRPALGNVPESLMMMISTPYARRGLLFDTSQKHFAQPGPVLVWRASTAKMNPTYDKETIRAAFELDPEAAGAEYEVKWRADLTTYIPFDALQRCVVPNVHEHPPLEGLRYSAQIDPSLLGQDSFTLAIAHLERTGLRVLDVLRERKPGKGLSPEAVVQEFANVMRAYRITAARSDRFCKDWIKEKFELCGIRTIFPRTTTETTSNNYMALIPLIMNREVELLDHRALIGQLADLDRRMRPGATVGELITHRPNAHDDLAAAAAGAIVNVSKSTGCVWESQDVVYQRWLENERFGPGGRKYNY